MRDLTRDISQFRPDLCVIGLEPAGFEIAFGAAALGVPVMVVTLRNMPAEPSAGMPDPIRRLAALGVRIIEGEGAFTGPNVFATQSAAIRARRFVLATGAMPARPAIEGIADLPALDLAAAAGAHLVIFGAGADGMARAQAARKAGARVSVLAKGDILAGFDPDAGAVVTALLERDGVVIRRLDDPFSASLTAIEDGQYRLAFSDGSGPVTFSHVAFDTGYLPAISGLGLDRAGVALREGAPVTDASLRTSNRRIYVAGAASGQRGPTLRSAPKAGAILKEVLFRKSGALDPHLLPRLVATRPALAEFGIVESDIPARERGRHRFLRVPLGEGSGHVKVITTPQGGVAGASVLAGEASELLAPLMLAAARRIPLQALAELPLPGATHADAIRALGALALRERLRSPSTARLIRFLRWFR
jgi:pyruvate/2-oxoglutarate dehydrogenase complex dihydrolipoamide dehydrogenase (E3) component